MCFVGAHHGERGRERVGHVVIAEQRELGARDERRAEHDEQVARTVEVAIGDAIERREAQVAAGDARDHRLRRPHRRRW